MPALLSLFLLPLLWPITPTLLSFPLSLASQRLYTPLSLQSLHSSPCSPSLLCYVFVSTQLTVACITCSNLLHALHPTSLPWYTIVFRGTTVAFWLSLPALSLSHMRLFIPYPYYEYILCNYTPDLQKFQSLPNFVSFVWLNLSTCHMAFSTISCRFVQGVLWRPWHGGYKTSAYNVLSLSCLELKTQSLQWQNCQ